jgi:peptidoglycan/LPS O-acetylase OafA/YrhL
MIDDSTAETLPRTSIHLTTKDEKLPGLQILRFVAAFSVVLFHLFSNYRIYFGFSKNYFAFGNHGVDVFFVLSGFVITYTTHPEKGSLYLPPRCLVWVGRSP